jgi:pimeloyl-ACP methyl ester carboxylesterase
MTQENARAASQAQARFHRFYRKDECVRMITPLFRVCDGVRVRFADNKADSPAVTVLMLSPWPESLWAYRLVPWSNNQYLADLLPNNEIHPLDAGHFAWEQASEDYGRLVVDWVTGGYRRVGAVTA